MACSVYKLGFLDYSTAKSLQDGLVESRIAGEINDTLLILEHPPTITIGSSGSLDNVLVSQQILTDHGIQVFFTDRGGDVTYHGPGQIVCYPIIDLDNRGKDLHRYVHDLEQTIISTIQDFDTRGQWGHAHRGVWVGNKQIASIGIRVKRWVTMHGFSLNVAPDLEPFSLINPCGLVGGTVTSLNEQIQQRVTTDQVIERIMSHFSDVFHTALDLQNSILGWSRINGWKTTSLV
jgi:lipoate-protein ligase B